ncbi:hypothetical protein JMJ35_005969 [Cladonia borealis]|uniref:Uncharacterized protein n=1 Tax=Cladonia borealis TaxID=184061 RepID=A0AA39QZR3_9LECA|nr:hypothetical protein JMJ35_005969 [Cladonia borealis]
MQSSDRNGAEQDQPVLDKDPRPVNAGKRPVKELEAALGLLKKHDDTSRFVGLALLKPVLEQELSQLDDKDGGESAEIIQRVWGTIPAKFLDRLLKARSREGRSRDEAENMVGVAVAVLQAFMGLLESPQTDEKFIGRVPVLMSILHSTSPKMRDQIMQIIHCLAMTLEGRSAIFETGPPASNLDQPPLSYMLLTIIHADIMATVPYLQESLHSDDYDTTSSRLVKGYDVISSFIGYLITSMDANDGGDDLSIPMPPDLLLKVQGKITDILNATIEHLRERYDASAPSTRGAISGGPSTAAEASGTMLDDPLTLSQIQTLSLWLANEDNESLRKAAAGIMDVLKTIYQPIEAGHFLATKQFQARCCVLEALSGITQTIEGVEAFLDQDWWITLTEDLKELVGAPSSAGNQEVRGITILNILVIVLHSGATPPPKGQWISGMLKISNELMKSADLQHRWELAVGTCDLVVSLLQRATMDNRHKNQGRATHLLKTVQHLLKNETSLKDEVNRQVREDLENVARDLEALRDNRITEESS